MKQILFTVDTMFLGGCITVLSMVFGQHWFVFALFLFLNVVDWITGWMKARILGTEKSYVALRGILKKLGYWVMIAFSFMLSFGFQEIGKMLEVDLSFSHLLGWFVLASLCVNEARSILENFVEAGYNVPTVLVKGLEVANTIINKTDNEKGK